MTHNDSASPRMNLTLADAVSAVLEGVVPLQEELVSLSQSFGRALSRAIHSPIDLPLWDNSGMDGYAVRRANVLGAAQTTPKVLPVRGTIAAGNDARVIVADGECVRIMTGAPVPQGADAVIRIEDTDRGTEVVRIVDDRDAQLASGNVRRRGEDVANGSLVFDAQTTVTAAHLAVMASVGCASVHVYKKPRVTLLSSGDELVTVDRFDQVLSGQRIVASSAYALPALMSSAGAHVTVMPIVSDTLESVERAMSDALDGGCDLFLTTGGVSVGAHDYTREALTRLGATITFWRARIRPGGPIGAGVIRGIPWIGLPGNPVSTMVTAELFARPVVRRLGGHANVHRAPITVRLTRSARTNAALTHLLRASVRRNAQGEFEAEILEGQGSNLMRTLALANALVIVPEGQDGAKAGDTARALLIGDDPLAATNHPWNA